MKEFDLHNEKIKSGFITPENYFNELESKLLLDETSKPKPKVIAMGSNKRLWYSGIAAVLALLFTLPMFLKSNTVTLDTIATEDLETYLTTEMSSYDLTNNANFTENIDFSNVLSINDEAVEDYFEYNQNLENYILE